MSEGRWWPTVTEVADHIASELCRGDTDMALRLLLDGVNKLPDADAAGRLDEAITEPRSTGDLRWDTLLAACIRYRLHMMGRKAPAWTFKKPLDKFWFPIRVNAVKEYNDMAHTPAELMRVGIFMDERGLAWA